MIIIAACSKESYYEASDAELKFSADTISFDTVFTSFGTATQRLKVFNPYDKILRISDITLAGESSPFILNINGIQANTVKDIEIYPNDSLYVFIQILVNPTGSNSPLFIRDSVLFTINGHRQDVKLLAYGQDVHVLRNDTIRTSVWEADKPYLIFGNIVVDSLQTLTIKSGTSIYFHKNANMIVKGSLVALGEAQSPITFLGDRLEKEYRDIPGQWGSIVFNPGSSGNQLTWCISQNGTSGVFMKNQSQLDLTNSILRNMSYNSLFAVNARLKAVNCVIADASGTCSLVGGGNYEFYHCTIANYYGGYISRNFSDVCLRLSNYYNDPEKDYSAVNNSLNAHFYNCITYSGYPDEIAIDSMGSARIQYKFDHCLLKSRKYNGINNSHFVGTVWNKDPKFMAKPGFTFRLDTLSAAKDCGNPEIGLKYPLDLKQTNRNSDKGPDIGAYERVEK